MDYPSEEELARKAEEDKWASREAALQKTIEDRVNKNFELYVANEVEKRLAAISLSHDTSTSGDGKDKVESTPSTKLGPAYGVVGHAYPLPPISLPNIINVVPHPCMMELTFPFGNLLWNLIFADRKSTRLNSSHRSLSRMPSSA